MTKATSNKRAEGKKLFNFGFTISEVEVWKKQAKKENRSLTNLIETVMNKYVNPSQPDNHSSLPK